jgi:hypothetical protein
MAQTNRQSQAYINQANQIAAQKQEQRRQEQQQEAQRASEQKQAKDAYSKATQQAAADLAAAKAEAKRNSQLGSVKLQAPPSNMQRQTTGSSSSGNQGFGGATTTSSSGSTDSSSGSLKPLKNYQSLDTTCPRMGRELMDKRYVAESPCNRPKRDDESFVAWRDAQSKCFTAAKAQLAPLQTEYAARCDKPAETGASKQ